MENSRRTQVFLASTSPRRIELLKQIGIMAEVHAPQSPEKRLRGESPERMVARLALEKAESVQAQLSELSDQGSGLIIAADTTVVAPDGKTVLGKPNNAADAARMLRLLAGRNHTVLTGYCILSFGQARRKVVRVVRSRVRMRALNKADISLYIATGEPMDKAGSYAAQGVGMALIERVQGSYTNVVGLPVCQVAKDLEQVFKLELFRWCPAKEEW